MLPFVSVVVPVRNEAHFIDRCIASVFAQDYPADRLEIIVADGRSTDGTRQLVESMRDARIPLRVITNDGQIVPTGLNAAIAQARGDIVVRVDGHCEIAPDYVRRCVEHLLTGVHAVGGPLATTGETWMARAIALGMSSTFGVGNSAFRTTTNETRFVDTVAFPAYSRSTLDALGPFDEELVRNQDDEFNYRLRKAGGRILLAADVRSTYFSRSALPALFRQYFQYGYWKVRVLQKHPRQMRLRQFAPPLFVAALLMLLALAPFAFAARVGFFAAAGAYLVANLIASVRASRSDRSLLPALPAIFAVLHLSYGAGFWLGLVRFRNRWAERTGAPPIRLAGESVAP